MISPIGFSCDVGIKKRAAEASRKAKILGLTKVHIRRQVAEGSFTMRIATFGSCLSLRVADQYRAAYGGNVISCVYHNRSDQFIGRFVDGRVDELSHEGVREAIGVTPGTEEDSILRNQCRTTMGSHLLKRWTPFLDALDKKDIDLLLIDNFMDASAALRSIGDMQFFSRVPATKGNGLRITPKLTPDQSAANFNTILRHFRWKLPDAAIVFTAFPWNTYPEGDREQRRMWEKRFSSRLRTRGGLVLPTKIVPAELHGDAPSHFRPQMYEMYAHDVRRLVERSQAPGRFPSFMRAMQQGLQTFAQASQTAFAGTPLLRQSILHSAAHSDHRP